MWWFTELSSSLFLLAGTEGGDLTLQSCGKERERERNVTPQLYSNDAKQINTYIGEGERSKYSQESCDRSISQRFSNSFQCARSEKVSDKILQERIGN